MYNILLDLNVNKEAEYFYNFIDFISNREIEDLNKNIIAFQNHIDKNLNFIDIITLINTYNVIFKYVSLGNYEIKENASRKFGKIKKIMPITRIKNSKIEIFYQSYQVNPDKIKNLIFEKSPTFKNIKEYMKFVKTNNYKLHRITKNKDVKKIEKSIYNYKMLIIPEDIAIKIKDFDKFEKLKKHVDFNNININEFMYSLNSKEKNALRAKLKKDLKSILYEKYKEFYEQHPEKEIYINVDNKKSKLKTLIKRYNLNDIKKLKNALILKIKDFPNVESFKNFIEELLIEDDYNRIFLSAKMHSIIKGILLDCVALKLKTDNKIECFNKR